MLYLFAWQKKYYCPVEDSKAYWIDSTKLVDLCEKADKTEPLLIGKKSTKNDISRYI